MDETLESVPRIRLYFEGGQGKPDQSRAGWLLSMTAFCSSTKRVTSVTCRLWRCWSQREPCWIRLAMKMTLHSTMPWGTDTQPLWEPCCSLEPRRAYCKLLPVFVDTWIFIDFTGEMQSKHFKLFFNFLTFTRSCCMSYGSHSDHPRDQGCALHSHYAVRSEKGAGNRTGMPCFCQALWSIAKIFNCWPENLTWKQDFLMECAWEINNF